MEKETCGLISECWSGCLKMKTEERVLYELQFWEGAVIKNEITEAVIEILRWVLDDENQK